MTVDARPLMAVATSSPRPTTAGEDLSSRASEMSPSSPFASQDLSHDDEDESFRAMAMEATRRQTKEETKGFGFHSCALQIKDQKKSKWFYTQVLGMDIVKETESHDVTMIFLAFPDPHAVGTPELEFGQRRGLLQLIHVAGDEDDASFKIRHGQPGFCHLCVNVPDLEGVLARMQGMGVSIVETAKEQGYAVIADHDGYNIQLLSCQIDQSLALKRQLAKIITPSIRDSVPPMSTSRVEIEGEDGLPQPSDTSLSGMPDFNSFRGGSPDLEHPHWSGIIPRGEPSASPAHPAAVQHSAPPVEATAHKDAAGGVPSRPATAVPLTSLAFAKLQASTSASASSTAYSNGSTKDCGSFASSATKTRMDGGKGLSPRLSMNRSNAPKSLDLTCAKGRSNLGARRKTMSPSSFSLGAGGGSISSYFKVTHTDIRAAKTDHGTHRSLPASPGEVREKLMANDEASGTPYSHRIQNNGAVQPKRPGTSTFRSLRDRLAFNRVSRQR